MEEMRTKEELIGEVEVLRLSEEKYRLVAENTSDFIAIMTFDGIFTYVSLSYRQLGYEPGELIGRSGFDLVHPDDRKRVWHIVDKYTETGIGELIKGQEKGLYAHVEFRFSDKTGSWHNIESTANIVKSFSGDGHEILMASRDITARKKNEAIIKEHRRLLGSANKELKSKIKALEDAAGRIKTLEGLVPICAKCKKMLAENGDPKDPEAWMPLEKYISERTDVSLTHGFCPDCVKQMYGEAFGKNGKR